jgi:hypothetical protein
MLELEAGKLQPRDQRVANVLAWAPWLSLVALNVPLPTVFLVLFLGSVATDSAAVYLLLFFVSLGLGLVVGGLLLIFLMLYRRRWHSRLRDRLAIDGITAQEVHWFRSELSSEERNTWDELQSKNPLLADAYCETLAARLTATRIIARSRGGILKAERQINRARSIGEVDTSALVSDLTADRQRFEDLRREAKLRLSEAKARLQTIEAAANRTLTQQETEGMLRRLTASQEHFPLALEMANLERDALLESDRDDDLLAGGNKGE